MSNGKGMPLGGVDLGSQNIPVGELVVRPVALMDVKRGAVLDIPCSCYVRMIFPGEGKVIVVPFELRALRNLIGVMQTVADEIESAAT